MKRLFSLCFFCLFFAKAQAVGVQIPSKDIIEPAKNGDWLIIDVRSEDEFAEGHVPGALNIPHNEINAHLAELSPFKDKPVVVYCRSGFRATKALKTLSKHEFSDLRHLEGDMLGWRKAKLPEETGAK